VTTYEHVVSMPFDEIPGANDEERAEKLIQRCMEVRGVKVKMVKVPIPVAFGSAFEGERVRKDNLRMEFGGKRARAFEYLKMVPADQVEDGKVTVVGADVDEVDLGGSMSLGIIVDVAGRKMQPDFESIIERQFHYFVNMAEGIQHVGQRDITWIRLGNAAFDKGFRLEHLGKLLHARIHDVFGNIVDKVAVTLVTDESRIDGLLEQARAAYRERNERIAALTDESVDTFYSCLLCQSFAPTHVCVVNPERVGLCGALQLAGLQGELRDQPDGSQPAGCERHVHRPRQGRVQRPERVHRPALQPGGGSGHLLLHHGGPTDLLRLFRVHHGARARGQRIYDRQPRGPEHETRRA